MARYVGPKCRLCRREGIKLFLKGERCFSPKCPVERKGPVGPGQHGHKMARRSSGYRLQLREKQKVKQTYGVLERQLRNYIKEAFKQKGNVGENLLRLLERRLDNVIYRGGIVLSRSIARQLVNHRHCLLNGKKMNIPSCLVRIGDIVTIDNKALKNESVKKALEAKPVVPSWLKKKAVVLKVERLPGREEINEDISEQLIIEFYSR